MNVEHMISRASLESLDLDLEMPPLHPRGHAPIPALWIIGAEFFESIAIGTPFDIELMPQHFCDGTSWQEDAGMDFDHDFARARTQFPEPLVHALHFGIAHYPTHFAVPPACVADISEKLISRLRKLHLWGNARHQLCGLSAQPRLDFLDAFDF